MQDALRAPLGIDELLESATHGPIGGELDPALDHNILAHSALEIAARPRSAKARFAHACLLAQHGLHDQAAAAVQALRDVPDCPQCSDALHNVGIGSACEFDERTIAIANGAPRNALRRQTQKILASFAKGEPGDLTGTLIVRASCSVCDDASETAGRIEVGSFARSYDGPAGGDRFLSAPVFMFCEGRCCSGPTGMLSHSSDFVTSVCFTDGSATKLASINLIGG